MGGGYLLYGRRLTKADFDKGEYQLVAEIINVLVYTDPTNEVAHLLCADAPEQLGYQAGSGRGAMRT